jgi:hypothetical protein
VADGGSFVPETSENPIPACSNTAPSRITRVRPPPPSLRAPSGLPGNVAAPSAPSIAAQMRS